MSGNLMLIAGFFVVVLVTIVLAGYGFLTRKDTRNLDNAGVPDGLPAEETPLASTQAALAKALRFMGESVPAAKRHDETLRMRLLKAGYRWPTAVTIFHGIRVSSALTLAGVAGWCTLLFRGDTASTLLPALCAGGFGFLLPERILQARVRARGRRIRSAMPSAVDLLVLALEAGQSLDQSLQDVARALAKGYPDLSEEFVFCRLEMRAGKSRYEALRHLSERSPDAELKALTAVLLDSDRYGTSLGPALRTHARYLRTRIRHGAQEAARKLSVKLTLPVFFLIFPSILLVTLGPAVLQLRESLRFLMEGF